MKKRVSATIDGETEREKVKPTGMTPKMVFCRSINFKNVPNEKIRTTFQYRKKTGSCLHP